MNDQTPSHEVAQRSYDGVRLAILNKRFESVVGKMANTLLRTGRSGVLNMARDFSCCIVTSDHELVTAAECYPIHVLRGADLMSRAMKQFHPELKRGDAFLHNSPYHGNSHAADHTIMVPVIDEEGIHRFTVLAKAHQADCGDSLPTTYMGAARDVYEEGALIFPAVKVQSDYQDIQDIIRMCEMRIRVPEQWRGDYLAMVGAAHIGERAMLEMGNDLGWEALAEHTRELFDYGEHRMIEAIRHMPRGRAVATATHDPVPGTPPEGITVQAAVEISPEDAHITVDLRDNPDAYPCGLNLSQACALTAAMVGVFNCIGHTVPANAGSFRRVDVLVREGSVAGVPNHPTSCSVATTNLGDRVTCAVQRALAELGEDIGMADGGAAIPAAAGVISGKDLRHGGAPFCNEIILGGGAGPGNPFTDGWLTMLTMGNAGMPYLDSIEVDEIHHPIRITERRIIPDSEGAGKFRGGPSTRIEFGPVDSTLEVGYVSDGTVNPAKGARGGSSAYPNRHYRRKRDGTLEPITEVSVQTTLEPGEFIVSETAGGGGYGPIWERDLGAVRKDVQEGWISAKRAAEVYGVVINSQGDVDMEATTAIRASLQSVNAK
ncbi:MAG: hydantoinase B/oxoprolinase family protein [Gammaproteobacteria bacterium]|nr:hydantoinase B/oxoprolinase family protein [Gammaproteobacteria bacterium]